MLGSSSVSPGVHEYVYGGDPPLGMASSCEGSPGSITSGLATTVRLRPTMTVTEPTMFWPIESVMLTV